MAAHARHADTVPGPDQTTVEAQYGEFVIPADLVTPAHRMALNKRFGDHKIRIVGSGKVNPATGLEGFFAGSGTPGDPSDPGGVGGADPGGMGGLGGGGGGVGGTAGAPSGHGHGEGSGGAGFGGAGGGHAGDPAGGVAGGSIGNTSVSPGVVASSLGFGVSPGVEPPAPGQTGLESKGQSQISKSINPLYLGQGPSGTPGNPKTARGPTAAGRPGLNELETRSAASPTAPGGAIGANMAFMGFIAEMRAARDRLEHFPPQGVPDVPSLPESPTAAVGALTDVKSSDPEMGESMDPNAAPGMLGAAKAAQPTGPSAFQEFNSAIQERLKEEFEAATSAAAPPSSEPLDPAATGTVQQDFAQVDHTAAGFVVGEDPGLAAATRSSPGTIGEPVPTGYSVEEYGVLDLSEKEQAEIEAAENESLGSFVASLGQLTSQELTQLDTTGMTAEQQSKVSDEVESRGAQAEIDAEISEVELQHQIEEHGLGALRSKPAPKVSSFTPISFDQPQQPEQLGQTMTPDQRDRIGAIIGDMSMQQVIDQLKNNPKTLEVEQMLEDQLNTILGVREKRARQELGIVEQQLREIEARREKARRENLEI